jgi:hypothetical protein
MTLVGLIRGGGYGGGVELGLVWIGGGGEEVVEWT